MKAFWLLSPEQRVYVITSGVMWFIAVALASTVDWRAGIALFLAYWAQNIQRLAERTQRTPE